MKLKALVIDALVKYAPKPIVLEVLMLCVLAWIAGTAHGYFLAMGQIKPRIAAIEQQQMDELQPLKTQVEELRTEEVRIEAVCGGKR